MRAIVRALAPSIEALLITGLALAVVWMGGALFAAVLIAAGIVR